MISDKPSFIPQGPPKPKQKQTVIETINSPSITVRALSIYIAVVIKVPDSLPSQKSTSSSSAAGKSDSSSDGSDEEEDAATLTPSALAFSRVQPLDFPNAFRAISNNPNLLAESTTDALLVEAFTAAMKGDDKRARQCVEKGLVIQYCLQLGRDGVALYFRK